jgi:hypothetical protein
LVYDAVKVGRSQTAHGTGRAVLLNERAFETLNAWAAQIVLLGNYDRAKGVSREPVRTSRRR